MLAVEYISQAKRLDSLIENKREEEKAKKVLRNVIIGLVVIAVGIIAVAAFV